MSGDPSTRALPRAPPHSPRVPGRRRHGGTRPRPPRSARARGDAHRDRADMRHRPLGRNRVSYALRDPAAKRRVGGARGEEGARVRENAGAARGFRRNFTLTAPRCAHWNRRTDLASDGSERGLARPRAWVPSRDGEQSGTVSTHPTPLRAAAPFRACADVFMVSAAHKAHLFNQ
jgi:hypothetical protein